MSVTAPNSGEARELRSGWLVLGAAASPAAWVVHIVAMPALVPFACETGRSWPLGATTALCALVAVAGLAALRRTRRVLGHDDIGDDRVRSRARAWSSIGSWVGVLFLVLILVEHVPVLVLSPCPP